MADIALPVRKFKKGSIDPRTGLTCEGFCFVKIPPQLGGSGTKVNLKTKDRKEASDRVGALLTVQKIIDTKIGEF